MAISYGPLRELMGKKGVTWYQLVNQGIDPQTLQRLRHDRPISTKTIDRLCQILTCQPGDLLAHTPE